MSLALASADSAASYLLSRWIFLRALGLICLVAFVSFWVQARGLIGSGGLLPLGSYLQAVRESGGSGRFALCPTVFWLNASDQAVQVVCALGVLAALALTVGAAPIPALFTIWVLYLSLCTAGQDFMWFQWDALLLETCFLAMFLAPPVLWPGLGRESAVPPVARWLLWWLLFRLLFESGVVKLTSGDPTWRHLTALEYHYHTQPLPTWLAWYAQHLPAWFQRLSVLIMFLVEIGLPLGIFAWRPLRLIACGGIVLLQVLILLTGNYNFFNFLTIALALFLLDDAAWLRLLPGALGRVLGGAAGPPAPGMVQTAAAVVAAVVFGVVGLLQVEAALWPGHPAVRALERRLNPLGAVRSLNSYGLFRVMTTQRDEIVIEGSMDGRTWQAYEFRYKPGDPRRRPRFVEPHQPRLDWQMWFAALSSFEAEPWLQNLFARLFEGRPEVLALLRNNPFPDRPPRFLRAQFYRYEFTTPPERRATGAWWRRRLLGPYAPVCERGTSAAT